MDFASDQMFAGPDGTALRFFYEPSKNNFQSEKAGRPIFDSSLMVEVIVPGQSQSMPIFEVERTFCDEAGTDASGQKLVERSPKYIQYQVQVEAFKSANSEAYIKGTPLSQWPQIDVGTAATLKAQGIYSVEMLSQVSDGNLQHLGMGGRVLRDQARGFLNSQQFGIPTAQMSAENANTRDENIRLQAQVDDLTKRLAAATGQLAAARTGQPAPIPAPGSVQGQNQGSALLDPLGPGTIAAPNPFASLDSGTASPLTPTEGEAGDNAKAAAEATGQNVQPHPSATGQVDPLAQAPANTPPPLI